jgi:hypothetical protein
MNDPTKLLAHYGIVNNSKIMMLGDCLIVADPQGNAKFFF